MDCIKSCELDPDNAESQFQLGALYDRTKRPGEAVKHFQKWLTSIRLRPAWDIWRSTWNAWGSRSRRRSIQGGLEVIMKGKQFDAFLDYNYGRFLASEIVSRRVSLYLDRAVERVPDYRDTWYDRAKLNFTHGNYAQARSDAERAATSLKRRWHS